MSIPHLDVTFLIELVIINYKQHKREMKEENRKWEFCFSAMLSCQKEVKDPTDY